MSISKAVVMLKQLETSEEKLDIKRIAKIVREALADIEARLKAIESKLPPERR